MARPYRPDQGLNRRILDSLTGSEVPLRIGPLARAVDSDTRAVVTALARMERHGLVHVLDADWEGRRFVLVTDQGRRVLDVEPSSVVHNPVPRSVPDRC